MPGEPSFTIDGDTLRLITDGPERLAALLDLIAGAKHSLRILYYIYVDDDAGAKVRAALIDAARRGVTVRLIVDGMGSEHAQAHRFFEPLSAAGVNVCRFVPRWGRRYLLRNHQKLALADDARAIIGGFNIEDAYFRTIAEQGWRDLGVYVEGPAATHLAGYFDGLDAWAKREQPPLRDLRAVLRQWSQAQGTTRWLFGGPFSRPSPWARSLRDDLRQASRADLISAYFAPSPGMLRRLDRLGMRGTARVVLASKNDHGAAIWASRFTYAGLLRKRVEIWEYQPTKLHTKLFVIDDVVYLGSANYDIRSLFLNLELMLRIEDAGFAAYVRSYVDGEIANSERITPALYKERTSLWMRVKQAAAFFVMTVLDYNITRSLNFGHERRRRAR
ncbi:MAG: phosphatidylserine/phosphatidylglycerophosphate/cardiolipin synthase family protein [Sphingomonas sp.]|uniref:phospholipase D-like domain-containing protein n=1 Tax=Sphingomonas sp. TaxID=28214 RepID=UPI001AC41725|nr:phosphatidylserine/phosphatidylglycerophosphate/cardiolipin synthase family protein [Sphingomonas sp.]MBN8808052.1 phosphatidylserine/phosphatidylglycerophosphate/cardiolipin synthase family protein [Sphingomonas sp.]